jgi:hypothetical protein
MLSEQTADIVDAELNTGSGLTVTVIVNVF